MTSDFIAYNLKTPSGDDNNDGDSGNCSNQQKTLEFIEASYESCTTSSAIESSERDLSGSELQGRKWKSKYSHGTSHCRGGSSNTVDVIPALSSIDLDSTGNNDEDNHPLSTHGKLDHHNGTSRRNLNDNDGIKGKYEAYSHTHMGISCIHRRDYNSDNGIILAPSMKSATSDTAHDHILEYNSMHWTSTSMSRYLHLHDTRAAYEDIEYDGDSDSLGNSEDVYLGDKAGWETNTDVSDDVLGSIVLATDSLNRR